MAIWRQATSAEVKLSFMKCYLATGEMFESLITNSEHTVQQLHNLFPVYVKQVTVK